MDVKSTTIPNIKPIGLLQRFSIGPMMNPISAKPSANNAQLFLVWANLTVMEAYFDNYYFKLKLLLHTTFDFFCQSKMVL